VRLILSIAIAAAFALGIVSTAGAVSLHTGKMRPVPAKWCPGPGSAFCSDTPSHYGSGCYKNAYVEVKQKTATGLATAWQFRTHAKWACWVNGQITHLKRMTKFHNVDSFSDVDGTSTKHRWISNWAKCVTDDGVGGFIFHCATTQHGYGTVHDFFPIIGTYRTRTPEAWFKFNGRGYFMKWGGEN
jgi:hypothetical protein